MIKKDQMKIDRLKKTSSFSGLLKGTKDRFCLTSINDMKQAGQEAAKTLLRIR